jgi:hypothetical protein
MEAYIARRSLFSGSPWGGRGRGRQANQMQFAPIQQLPLHAIARIQSDGRRQGQGKTHVEPGLLALRADRLDLQRIGRLHFF